MNSEEGDDSEHDFIKKVKAYEEEARADPIKYARKVARFAAFGYLAPLAFVILCVLIVMGIGYLVIYELHGGGAILFKLIIAVGVMVYVVIRSMWVRFDEPEGIEIKAKDAPKLFSLIEETRLKAGGPRLHKVILDDALNASIQQNPRFGLLGGHRNILTIGLPLLSALSEKQFQAVLAHEYGHLAGAHGKTSSWVYRSRIMWTRLDEELRTNPRVPYFPLGMFFKDYAPAFNAMSFPLARVNEYEADRTAVQIAGSQSLAQALIRVDVVSQFLSSRFWPNLFKRAANSPEPDTGPLREMSSMLKDPTSWPEGGRWLKFCAGQQTGYADTHPSLTDRLAAIGLPVSLPEPISESADDLLGDKSAELAENFDARWREEAKDGWRARYEQVKEQRKKLVDLETRAHSGTLNREDSLLRAVLEIDLSDVEKGEGLLREHVRTYPGDPDGLFRLGQLLAEKDDGQAVAYLEKASTLQPTFQLGVEQILRHFYMARGDNERAAEHASRALEEERRHIKASEELSALHPGDDLLPPTLSTESMQALRDYAAELKRLKAAFVVRKKTALFEKVFAHHIIFAPSDEKHFDYDGVVEHLQDVDLKEELYIQFAVENRRWMLKAGQSVDGAGVYPL